MIVYIATITQTNLTGPDSLIEQEAFDSLSKARQYLADHGFRKTLIGIWEAVTDEAQGYDADINPLVIK